MKRLSLALAILLGIAGPVFAQDAGGGAAGGGGAAASAAASSSSAAASPSTSTVTAPATTTAVVGDAGAASAAATSTPSIDTPAAGLTQNAGESDGAFLARVMEARSAGDAGQGTPEPQTPAPDGQQPGEDSGQKTEETKTGNEGGEEDPFAFDPYAATPVLLAPKELFTKIDANPALKAALAADPEMRETLIAQSRAAAETAQFKEVFANADEAKIAQQSSVEYNTLANLVTSIQKPEDAQGFYGELLKLSVLKDDEGNPILRDGKPVSDGTVGRLIHHTGALFLNHFEQQAKASGNDELAAACEILRTTAFSDNKRSTEGLTEEQKAAQTQLDEQRNALNTEKQELQQAKTKEYEGAIVTGIDKAANDAITTLLGRTDLADGDREGTAAKIRAAAYELIKDNPRFQQEQDALMRRTAGPKTQAERVGLGRKWLNIALPIVAPKLIAEAGGKVLTQQQKQQQRQDARVDASRSEGAGTLRTPRATTPANGTEVTAQAISDFKTRNGGREPNTTELLTEIQRIRS